MQFCRSLFTVALFACLVSVVSVAEEASSSPKPLRAEMTTAEVADFIKFYKPGFEKNWSPAFPGEKSQKALKALDKKWHLAVAKLKPEQAGYTDLLISLKNSLLEVRRLGDLYEHRTLVELWFLRYANKMSSAQLLISQPVVIKEMQSVDFRQAILLYTLITDELKQIDSSLTEITGAGTLDIKSLDTYLQTGKEPEDN